MERLTLGDVVKATGGAFRDGDPKGSLGIRPTNVSIDSRTLKRGDLFFALRGELYDGHDFAEDALRKGACAVVVSQQWANATGGEVAGRGMSVIVRDTLDAFQACARYYRSRFSIPVVAVTGTNGKTTTKDMVAAALSKKGACLRTQGNLNNHIGLPLTLFRLRSEHRFAVVELGMRAVGEIELVAKICDPQIGVITNVGPAHIQFFGSLEEIARAKAELLDCLGPSGTAVLNGDDELVMDQRRRMRGKVVTFGLGHGADVRAEGVRIPVSGGMAFKVENGPHIELKTPGRFMVYNALAAIAVAREFTLPAQSVKDALEDFQPQPMRMEVCAVNGFRVLNDAYNANPVSMRGAVETLVDIPCSGKRIAVLGDMLELGEWALQAHGDMGKFIGESDVDHLLTVGELAHVIAEEAVAAGMPRHSVHRFENTSGVADALRDMVTNGDLILVKGSRKVGMEQIVEALLDTSTGTAQEPEGGH